MKFIFKFEALPSESNSSPVTTAEGRVKGRFFWSQIHNWDVRFSRLRDLSYGDTGGGLSIGFRLWAAAFNREAECRTVATAIDAVFEEKQEPIFVANFRPGFRDGGKHFCGDLASNAPALTVETGLSAALHSLSHVSLALGRFTVRHITKPAWEALEFADGTFDRS